VTGSVPLERPEVYQATGMVIAQLELSPDDALATLRAHAFVHDRPIDEVARDVVARTLRFAKEK
jgi:AmiR/NasT family two-component response regulator